MKRTLRTWFFPHKSNRHRPRILHVEGLGVLVAFSLLLHASIAALGSIPSLSSVLGYSTEISPERVLHLVNRERERAGKSPLALNYDLTTAAQNKAQDMASQQYWSHNRPSGEEPWIFLEQVGYSYSYAGENLARNFLSTRTMVNAWMQSPSHQKNLLNDRFTETGIAVLNTQFGSNESTLVVQLFAAPTNGITGSVPQPTSLLAAESEGGSLDLVDASVLGSQSAGGITPLLLYRLGGGALVIVLLLLLLRDFTQESRKKRGVFSKSLAHFILLLLALAIVGLAEGGGLL